MTRYREPVKARPLITDHRRVYSEAEFALILRKAAELENRSEAPRPASDGLTLAEMKAAASEVGIDPALVERAARLLPASSTASPFERLLGGPVRHDGEIHVPVALDEAGAARLLSAVQLSAGQPGTGHSSAIGMVWHAQDEGEPFSVTAQPEECGTSVAVRLDRRDTMASIQAVAAVGLVGATTAGFVVASQVGLELGAAAGVCGMGGILALGRLYWTSSTRRARERISGMVDAVGRSLAQAGGSPAASHEIGDSGSPETEAERLGEGS
ncbi:MAG TPA: hypothetical protein VFT04_04150 [Gemmatimonadales bacterium]|nr:hypothetical protein [Gemmatimonadales bacterium]